MSINFFLIYRIMMQSFYFRLALLSLEIGQVISVGRKKVTLTSNTLEYKGIRLTNEDMKLCMTGIVSVLNVLLVCFWWPRIFLIIWYVNTVFIYIYIYS